jgi:hypothetical protein
VWPDLGSGGTADRGSHQLDREPELHPTDNGNHARESRENQPREEPGGDAGGPAGLVRHQPSGDEIGIFDRKVICGALCVLHHFKSLYELPFGLFGPYTIAVAASKPLIGASAMLPTNDAILNRTPDRKHESGRHHERDVQKRQGSRIPKGRIEPDHERRIKKRHHDPGAEGVFHEDVPDFFAALQSQEKQQRKKAGGIGRHDCMQAIEGRHAEVMHAQPKDQGRAKTAGNERRKHRTSVLTQVASVSKRADFQL